MWVISFEDIIINDSFGISINMLQFYSFFYLNQFDENIIFFVFCFLKDLDEFWNHVDMVVPAYHFF